MTLNLALVTPVKLVLFDVDGVLTDGRLVIDDNGIESKFFNARDGAGLRWLQRAGLKIGFLTGRKSEVVAIRAKELGVSLVRQGALVKIDVYKEIIKETGLKHEDIAYAGDDLIDLPVMRAVGFSMAPSDARPEVLEVADFVSASPGGMGAVREMAEVILKAQGHWPTIMARYYAEIDF